jgi:manganese transport protein
VPPFAAGLITAVAAFAILGLQRCGYRRFELAIAGLLGIVLAGFLYETLSIGADAGGVGRRADTRFDGDQSVLLAAGILGATVMPHVIYLHSALTQSRVRPAGDGERRELVRFQRMDVVAALGLAGLVNLSMLAVAASLFHGAGLHDVATLDGAHRSFERLAGAALAFAVALLASGLSSSSVGTYAGQAVMQGFIDRTVPLAARRAVTMARALALLAVGADPARALIFSQVVLSSGIPFALVPLVMFTRRRDVTGQLANRPTTTVAPMSTAALIIGLNAFLLVRTFV